MNTLSVIVKLYSNAPTLLNGYRCSAIAGPTANMAYDVMFNLSQPLKPGEERNVTLTFLTSMGQFIMAKKKVFYFKEIEIIGEAIMVEEQ